MIQINKLNSNGHTLQLYHADKDTDIKKIDKWNQGYLMSARFFPMNGETEAACTEIIDECARDIFQNFKNRRKENEEFYKHFECTDNFWSKSVSSYREKGKQGVLFVEVFYDTKLNKRHEE